MRVAYLCVVKNVFTTKKFLMKTIYKIMLSAAVITLVSTETMQAQSDSAKIALENNQKIEKEQRKEDKKVEKRADEIEKAENIRELYFEFKE